MINRRARTLDGPFPRLSRRNVGGRDFTAAMRLPVLLLAAATTACSSLPTKQVTLETAIAEGMSVEFTHGSPPVFVSDPRDCTAPPFSQVATIRVAELNDPTFPARFPKGVFVVCDVTESSGKATAHYQRVSFHSHLNAVKVAEHGTIRLLREHDGWKVVDWARIAVDYSVRPNVH